MAPGRRSAPGEPAASFTVLARHIGRCQGPSQAPGVIVVIRIVGTEVDEHVCVVNDVSSAIVWSGGKTLSQCAVTGSHRDAGKLPASTTAGTAWAICTGARTIWRAGGPGCC